MQRTRLTSFIIPLLLCALTGCVQRIEPFVEQIEPLPANPDMSPLDEMSTRDEGTSTDTKEAIDEGVDAKPDLAEFTKAHVALARSAVCLLEDAQVWCLGVDADGEPTGGGGDVNDAEEWVQIEPSQEWVELKAGDFHFCARNTSREVWCWGESDHAQTGRLNDSTPGRVQLEGAVERLELGFDSSCAFLQEGSLYCWGHNVENQLAPGSEAPIETPVEIEPVRAGQAWVEVSPGEGHLCVIDDTGELWCRGRNTAAMITPDSRPIRLKMLTSIESQGPWEEITCGSIHTCGVRQGEVWCWGMTVVGQQAGEDQTTYPTPLRLDLPKASDIVAIDSHAFHACALDRSGQMHCWGRAIEGQLGERNSEPVLPRLVALDAEVEQLDVSRFQTCVRTTEEILCAGVGLSGWVVRQVP